TLFSIKADPEKKAEKTSPPVKEKTHPGFNSDTFKFITKKVTDIPLLNFSKDKETKTKTPADVDQVMQKYNELSKKIDQDGNGLITKKELVRMVNDKNVKGEDAAFVGVLLNKYFEICDAADDELFKDDD